jgi:protein translocase SecG subunit
MRIVLLFIHIAICVVLIILVALMQQKHEGLSGIMGGMQSVRGIKGMDEGMRRIITYTGVAFFVSCIINSFLTGMD